MSETLDIERVCPKKPFQRISCEATGCPYAKNKRHCVPTFLGQHLPVVKFDAITA